MQGQGALADPALAGADGDEMAHPGEPVGDPGALLGNLLEDSGASVAGDVVVALHFLPGGFAPPDPPTPALAGALWPRSAPAAHSLRSFATPPAPQRACRRGPNDPEAR